MIRLEPMNKDNIRIDELALIAYWRNKSLISLRTTDKTKVDGQVDWIKSFDDSVAYFYIYYDNKFAGYCGLDKINLDNETAELGMLVSPEIQRTKIGFTATQMLLQHGFYSIGLNCIFIEVYCTTDNWNFWERCGFTHEGVLRARKVWEGTFYNSRMGSLLKGEWTKTNFVEGI